MDRYEELNDLVQTFKNNFDKFYIKGNKAAGVRLRKNMQQLRRFGKNIRDEVQNLKRERSDSRN